MADKDGWISLDSAAAPAAPDASGWISLVPQQADTDPGAIMGEGLPPSAVPSGQDHLSGIKDLGIGALEGVTGIGEMIPGNTYAAKETQALHSQLSGKHPWMETAGQVAPWLLGGDVLGAGKAADFLIPKAEQAAGFLKKVGTDIGRGAVKGGVTGGEAGLATPTGEEDTEKRFAKKGETAAALAPMGALAGGLLGTAGGTLAKGSELAKKAFGGEAKEAAEALRGETSGRVAGTAAESAAKSEDLLKKAGEINTRLDQETEKLDSVKGAAGDAQADVERIQAEFKANPAMDAKTFGDRVRQLSQDTYKKYRDKRATESGYSAAIDASTDDPTVKTDKIQSYLQEWEKGTVNENDRSIINYLRENTQNGLSPKQADSLRKVLDEAYRTKAIKTSNTSDANAATSNFRIARVHAQLVQALREADPRLAEAMKKFKELSRPLDDFERKGPLAGALKTDRFSGEPDQGSAALVGQLLTKTRGGLSPFGRLIAEDPGLKADARQFFQGMFKDADTPEKMDKLLESNRDALRQTDLFEEFKVARDKLSSSTSAVGKLADQAKVQEGNVDAIQKTFADAVKAKGASEEIANKYSDFFTELKDKNLQTKDVTAKAGSVIKSMRKDGFIDSETYDRLLGDINDVKTKYADEAEARKRILSVIGEGVLLFAGYKAYKFVNAEFR